jgi:peroxiredoxin/predicted 2-oxoglutarate/Fe(II)-dependent dioxygenase YbiX
MPVNYPPIPPGRLAPGDFAPWFTLPSDLQKDFSLSSLGGLRTLLFLFGTSRAAEVAAFLAELEKQIPRLGELGVIVVGISMVAADRAPLVLKPLPWMRVLIDDDGSVSRQYGVYHGGSDYFPTVMLLNENLRVTDVLPLRDSKELIRQTIDAVERLPIADPYRSARPQAPVLLIPHLLSPALCQELIDHHELSGGVDSAFMQERDGKTHAVLDHTFKRRRDVHLVDPGLLSKVNRQITRRVTPEVFKAFQFQITRFERHLIACYSAKDRGEFAAHRDNTTRGTAHRRFAMTLNLNEDAYEGGELRFPEYGNALFRPRTGEAVLFSCSLQHQALPVTKGRRFALLSFFYDEPARLVREANLSFVADP